MNICENYIRLGWHLIPIPAGRKGPCYAGWNRPENEVTRTDQLSAITENVGLAHAYSGTCAIDIDDLEAARVWLAERLINLDWFLTAPDAVLIDSGRPNRAKLLYRLPPDIAPPETRNFHCVEFRCGTKNGLTVQDVLPPSLHADTGQPYRWAGSGSFDNLPRLPFCLLALWQPQHHINPREWGARYQLGVPA